MIKYIMEEREVMVGIESIQCDKCKKVYSDEMELQEFNHIELIGGYSSVFGDGSKINIDICQHCLYDMIKGCDENTIYIS